MLPLTENQKHSRLMLEASDPEGLKHGQKGILDFQIA